MPEVRTEFQRVPAIGRGGLTLRGGSRILQRSVRLHGTTRVRRQPARGGPIMPETKPLPPQFQKHDMCACFNLRKAARAVTQAFDAHLQPSGLRVTQLSVLGALHHGGPSSVSDLADRLVMDRTTLTRNLQPLQRRDLITLGPGDDRRTRRITLTDAGRKAMAEAFPLWREAQREIIGRLGAERWQATVAALGEIVALTQEEG
jgi:DNA-binding MarR family transcriptional regulator